MSEYELKIGVFCDERLQVTDLLKYLEAEMNDLISTQVKKLTMGAKTGQRFSTTFEQIPHHQIEEQQYVGFLFIFNGSNFQSLQHTRQTLTQLNIRGTDETFVMIVEMETKDKLNLAQMEGVLLAQKYHADYVKLTFENTGELLNNISRYINQMLEGYYNPTSVIGEEDEQQSEDAKHEYELNYMTREKQSQYVQKDQPNDQEDQPLFQDDPEEIGLIDRAIKERESRLQDINEQEKDIDANIQNLQKVLQTMDVHIRSKIETDWFSSLKQSIYSRAEKESGTFSKIKLTQHFLKETEEPGKVQRIPVETIFINRRRKLLMRLQLVYNKMQFVVEVFNDSTYGQLAKIALRKIGLKISERNFNTMRKIIEQNVSKFVGQLTRAISAIHDQKLASRKFLKKQSISST